MIDVVCNMCRRIIRAADHDAMRDSVNGEGVRVDVCGPCMRGAAQRVLAICDAGSLDASKVVV